MNRHKKVKHGITEPVDTSEEEAAKILNAMSTAGTKRRAAAAADHFTAEDSGSYEGFPGGDGGFPGDLGGEGGDDPGSSPSITPNKKKRKSTPRKTIPTVKTLDGEGDGEEDGFTPTVGDVAWPGDEMVPPPAAASGAGAPRAAPVPEGGVSVTGRRSDVEDIVTYTTADVHFPDVRANVDVITSDSVESATRDDSLQEGATAAGDLPREGGAVVTDEESSESVDVQRKNLATLIAKKFKPPLKVA